LKQVTTADEKKAALALHALAASDREQVLRRLTEDQRERLRPLLMELVSLGIPANIAETSLLPKEPSISRCESSLSAVPATVIARLLASQSVETIGALFAAGDWTWKDDVLEQLPLAKRRAVDSVIRRQTAPAPSVCKVLVEQLQTAVSSLHAEGSHTKPVRHASVYRKLMSWMR
jgi:hypothetical protein